ncbi:uncharacterized protein LOC135948332 [Cloeon dipterum]|uniref:uncharacterized protein LOC135948332 n=1 Tax=Cloeon dipterum TaxID=197152 RepID=UPI003220347D
MRWAKRPFFAVFATLLGYVAVVLLFESIKKIQDKVREEYLKQGDDGVWQKVVGTKYEFLVFSAYVEDRDIEVQHSFKTQPAVRIVGVGRQIQGKMAERLYCRFLYNTDKTSGVNESGSVLGKAALVPIKENWGLNYTACFIFCSISKNGTIPSSVSIYSEASSKRYLETQDLKDLNDSGNRLSVQNRRAEDRKVTTEINMAACINPMHSNFSRVWPLIEWLEMNKMLGVSHFYFYNRSMAPNVSCAFNHYIKKGEVTVLDWRTNLPRFLVRTNVQIRDGNIFAAMNDCLYRGMFKHKYLMFADFDEFLVPEGKDANLLKFVEKISAKEKKVASFLFKNTFYFLEWPTDPKYKGLDLITQTKTIRQKGFDPPMSRSKYITKPERVTMVGNHFVWENTNGAWTWKGLNETEASSRHYRICEFPPDVCRNPQRGERDARMWDFEKQLSEKMNQVQEEIGKKCGLERIKMV